MQIKEISAYEGFDAGTAGRNGGGAQGNDNASGESAVSVSYTHLDVYKRQLYTIESCHTENM